MATGCEDSASKKQKGAAIHLTFHLSGEPGQQALALRRATAEPSGKALRSAGAAASEKGSSLSQGTTAPPALQKE